MSGLVKVTLLHRATKGTVIEKRLFLTQTISQVKAVCATHYETQADHMALRLLDASGQLVEGSPDDERPLGYYQVQDGWTVEVNDTRGDKAKFIGGVTGDDMEGVEKYVMPEHEWLKRPDNVRAYKEKILAAQRAEAIANGETVPELLHDDSFKEQADAIAVGDRCQVAPGDRLGTVRYVGRLAALKPGFWIGVEFDEPVGKNDGTVKGARVFECRPNYGGLVRPKDVVVGDFPAEEF